MDQKRYLFVNGQIENHLMEEFIGKSVQDRWKVAYPNPYNLQSRPLAWGPRAVIVMLVHYQQFNIWKICEGIYIPERGSQGSGFEERGRWVSFTGGCQVIRWFSSFWIHGFLATLTLNIWDNVFLNLLICIKTKIMM